MTMQTQAGFSPVEVLVALIVGLVITVTVLQVYIADKQTYRAADASARLQENARFASELMATEIRMAGYQGCAGAERTMLNKLQDASSFPYNFDIAAQGFDATGTDSWTPTLDGSVSSALGGGDVLTIRGLFGGETAITGTTDTGNCGAAPLVVADASELMQGDIAVAGNCQAATVFQITGVSGTDIAHAEGGASPGNTAANLGQCFAGDGALGRLSTRTFYIRDNPAGVPSLYRMDVSGPNTRTEELIEGIEGMQVLYGVDTDSDLSANQYLRAADISDWSRIHSVRLSFLFRSVDDYLATDAQPYYFNGAITNPDDRRLRSVFTTTIGLRNRLP
ncbi:MAG: PilW family protein [Thiohalocapsa sp.]